MTEKKIQEIKTLIKYGAPPHNQDQALAILDNFAHDAIALNLLHNFYSFLPEGLNDWINSLKMIAGKQGVFLICANTDLGDYIYLVNREKAEFLGSGTSGIWDKDIISFFGWQEEALGKQLKKPASLPEYIPLPEQENHCPACFAQEGEHHVMGCPVEVCPWCSSQLTRCNCRFEITGKKNLTSEKDLNSFTEKLTAKGRVPYEASSQRPSYPALD